MIRYPNIIGKSEAQQLEQIKSYLHQLADELNFRLEQNAGASAASATVMADTSSKPTKTEEAISNFNEIKGLIIKSADIVDSYSEQISNTLKGEFVAVSDFGTYTEDTLTELGISSKDIKSTITKVESIDDEVKNAVESEIKQTAESISLSVENGDSTAQIKLEIGGKEKTAEIAMEGLVTFSNLGTPGETEIDGGNIKTGKISADRIDATELVVNTLYALDGNGSGITLNKYGLQRESADGESPIVDLKHDWYQTSGVLEERPYFDLLKTHFDRDVEPGVLSNRKITGVHIDADKIEFRSDIGNFTDYPIHSYDHTVDFGIDRSGQVTGKLKVDAPTEDTHVVNKQYVDTSFAPSGYGLGGGGKAIASGDDLNNYNVGGFYQFTNGVANAPCDYAMMLVIPGTGYLNDTFQYVFSRYPTNNMAIRQLFDGTWGAWEWVNPPMAENTEYRTTERYKGKPVYALLKNLGAMPNSTTKTIYDLAVNVDNLVSADLTLDKGESRCIDNKFTELRWYIGCYSKPYIEISSTNDKSAYTGYLLFKYTKTTN